MSRGRRRNDVGRQLNGGVDLPPVAVPIIWREVRLQG